jgi:hypothetical protein
MPSPVLRFFLFLLLLVLTACGGDRYGAGVDPAAPLVPVRDVFLKPELVGSTVTVQGRIHTQCESNGCWFVLDDSTGQLYIDLAQNNFTLPAMIGRTVKATGTVASFRNSYLLVAQGVETQ